MLRHNHLIIQSAMLLSALWMLDIRAVAAPQQAQPATWNTSPVIAYARVAPVRQIRRDLDFVADTLDRGSLRSELSQLITDISQGIDETRPAGMVIYRDDDYVPVIFLPLKDEDALLSAIRKRIGIEFYRGDDGLYRASQGQTVGRVQGSWFFITGPSHRDQLQQLPTNPASIFTDSDPATLADVSVFPAQAPRADRDRFIQELSNGMGESASSGLAGVGITNPATWHEFLEDTQLLQLELQCIRPLEQFHITTRLKAAADGELGRWIETAGQRRSAYEHLISNNAVFAFVSSISLGDATTRMLVNAWKPVAAQARGAAPPANAADPALRSLGKLASRFLDAVDKTLQAGELSGGLILEGSRPQEISLLAGGRLDAARGVDEALSEVVGLLQNSAALQGLEWSVGGNADISMHHFRFPVEDRNVQQLFGSPMSAGLAFGTDSLYAAVGGEDVMKVLSETVDRSSRQTFGRGELLHISLRMSPFLRFLDILPGDDPAADQRIHNYAERIAAFGRNDTVDVSVKALSHTLEGRLRIDRGVVRMFASDLTETRLTDLLPPADADPIPPMKTVDPTVGPLRLRTGDTFDLVFQTDMEITTTIDNNDQVEAGRYVQTYGFRVIKVDDEGLITMEARMKRVTINKKNSEGEVSFDSAAPPDEEQQTAETWLNGLIVDQPFTMTVQPDGTIVRFDGLQQVIDDIVNTKLKPPADEREQARTLVAQLLNEGGLKDALSRGFEFYPAAKADVGERWSRTTENYSSVRFALDHRYQLRSADAEEAVISVISQIRNSDATEQNPAVQWEVAGSQTGKIHINPVSGLIRMADYTLRTVAEATLEVDGKTVTRPVVGVFHIKVTGPQNTSGETQRDAHGTGADGAWADLTDQRHIGKWQPQPRQQWMIEDGQIASRPGPAGGFQYCTWPEQSFTNFELSADVLYAPETNGGICIRAGAGELDGHNPSGYEVQIHGLNTPRNPTGSIFRIPKGGPVAAVYPAATGKAKPNTWFNMKIIAQDTRITVLINEQTVAEYNDLVEPIRSGQVMLQGSSEGTVKYRNVRLRQLP